MRSRDRARADRRPRDRARPRGRAAACCSRLRLDRDPAPVRAGAGDARRLYPRTRDPGAAGTSSSGAMTMPRRVTRRRLVGGLAATSAALAAPTILRARTADGPVIRLHRGMNLWPWFSLTREFPAPRTDYDWPPYQADRAIPT